MRALRNQKNFKSSRYGLWKNLHSSSKTCLTGTKVRTSIRSVAQGFVIEDDEELK